MELRSISATGYNTYDTCPYKFKLKYGIKPLVMPNPAFIVGTAFHKGAELYHGGTDIETILATIKSEMLNGTETTEKEIGRYGMVRQMIEAYVRNPVILPTIELEYNFKISVPGLSAPLYGFVDRVVEGGFVEYKTSIKVFKYEDIDNIQTDIYSYVYLDRFGFLPLVTYCIVHKTKSKKPDYKPQIMEIKREPEHMEELIRKLKTFEEKVHHDIFPPTPSYKCRWCEYSFFCKHNKYGN